MQVGLLATISSRQGVPQFFFNILQLVNTMCRVVHTWRVLVLYMVSNRFFVWLASIELACQSQLRIVPHLQFCGLGGHHILNTNGGTIFMHVVFPLV